MPAFRTCATCGKPTTNPRHCNNCTPHGRHTRSPTTRAQDADYRRHRQTVLADSPNCAYCPAPATTIDHIVAVSNGGTNALSNLVPACARCNRTKSNRDDWQPTTVADAHPKRTPPNVL